MEMFSVTVVVDTQTSHEIKVHRIRNTLTQMSACSETNGLYPCLFPGILSEIFTRWYHWGKLGEGYRNLFAFFLMAACESIVLSKQCFKNFETC